MISPSLVATEPDIPWRNIAAMRDQLAHGYFDTEHAIVAATVRHDLAPLLEATSRLQSRLSG